MEEILSMVEPSAPVRLFPLGIRRVMSTYSSKVEPLYTVETLGAEIDRIYAAKIAADLQQDKHSVPRRELLDFVVEYYATDPQIGVQSLAELQLYHISSLLHAHFSNGVELPPKLQLFALFLLFGPLEEVLPLPVLTCALHGKKLLAQAHNAGGSCTVHQAYDSAAKALPGMGPAGASALFATLVESCDPEDENAAPRALQCFNALLFDKDRLARSSSVIDCLQRCEAQGAEVTVSDFRTVLKESGLIGIDETIWRTAYGDSARHGMVANEVLSDAWRASTSAPSVSVDEAGFMCALTRAYMADFEEQAQPLLRAVESVRGKGEDAPGPFVWKYPQLKQCLQQANPSVSDPDVRLFYQTCIEYSHACTQASTAPIVGGQVYPVHGGQISYGGDTISDEVLLLAACQTQILTSSSAKSTVGADTPRTAVSDDAKKKPKKK